jgi:hypothetical protein
MFLPQDIYNACGRVKKKEFKNQSFGNQGKDEQLNRKQTKETNILLPKKKYK